MCIATGTALDFGVGYRGGKVREIARRIQFLAGESLVTAKLITA